MLSEDKGINRKTFVDDYVVFDLETTGLSNVKDHVVEISALKVRNHEVVDEFSFLVNPECHISAAASSVNGITDEMVEECPTFESVLRNFDAFAGDHVLVGQNIARFDLPFLYRDASRYWGMTIGNDFVDTLQIARICLPILNTYSLGALAGYYGIDTAGAHRALADCYMTHKVFEKLREEADFRKTDGSLKICPKCGSLMVSRKGPYGEFWGCCRYPDCSFKENIRWNR
ncbi:MAG: topoisomerase DNA-binding C4 zinc finger domain-containing protein [Clostridiales bacterium]|nr:topoisomerase DNA-binding C4 zinc finger domain-containing protein [Clostridiales bacterium]